MTEKKTVIFNGDCLDESEHIESGSVDLILTDPPYGNMQGIASGDTSWKNTNVEWDSELNPGDIFAVANRILRRNGKLVMFSQEPYTSQLTTGAHPNTPFSYRMIWEKDIYGNALFAKKAPLIFYEDILVFRKTHDSEGAHPLREYSRKLFEFIGKKKSDIKRILGHQKWVHFFQFDGVNNVQFSLCTESTYVELIEVFGIDRMDGFIPYEELREIDRKVKDAYFPSVFNLWEGGKYKSNILRYKKDYDGYHPTQKPVALIEDLIKTYSNEGDLVVDLTMGSGSTGVAAAKCGRRFIGIEKDDGYYEIARKRIEGVKEAVVS